jgi:hypothetical protein
MENIMVFDDVLNENEIIKVINIIKEDNWSFGHRSNADKPHTQKNIPFWYMGLDNNEFITTDMVKLIEEKCNKKLRLKKVYVNGQTYGQDGGYHIDTCEENCLTFCLYLPDFDVKLFDDVNGYLLIKIPNSVHNVYYESYFNRGVLFPSNYFHKALPYNRFISSLRVSIVWKFEEIKDI